MVAQTMGNAKPANTTTNGERNDAPQQATTVAGVPFIRASDENLAPGTLDKTSAQLSGNTQDFGITDLPAYGYLSHVYLIVEATGGTGTAAVYQENGPFDILSDIALTEPNGAYIVQFNSGYQLYLANKYGGYVNPVAADPKRWRDYTAPTSGNFKFMLRIPVCVSGRDGVGALPNQDSAGQFKLRLKINAKAAVFSTDPTTLPTVRVRAWMSSWDQPEQSSGGLMNATEPPANGTTSFWSVQSGITVNSGQNTIELKRKGNYLRQILFVLRNTTRAAGESAWPLETRFLRDAFPARYYEDNVWRYQMFEKTGYTGTLDAAGAPEAGIRFHDYMHEFDGALGRENRDLWQPTRGSTRLEITGNFQAGAVLDVIYNDVAIANNVFL